MGCCSSGVQTAGDSSEQIQALPPAKFDAAEAVSGDHGLHKVAHERLVKLQELDEATKIPFILIELTGEADGKGEIEVCGKDEYGVYAALDAYFMQEWGCEKLDPGDISEDTKIPFCALQYLWSGFRTIGDEGMNNMGRSVMRLIDFMCGRLSWTLAVVNNGNVGKESEVHEMQIIFKAPHPMNLVAPHLMIELRSAGYIEVCADLDDKDKEVMNILDEYFADRFQAALIDGHEDFCDRYYQAGDGIFKGTSGSMDSNFGILSTLVCNAMVKIEGWSLVACSSGSIGEVSEQQLVFRRDQHPLGDSPYIMVVLNEGGNVEVNGPIMEEPKDLARMMRKVSRNLHDWLLRKWHCQKAGQFSEGDTTCRRYTWAPLDFMIANQEMITFFEMQGFETQVCTQYMIMEDGVYYREQQLLFRPGKTEVGTIEPHLIVELYTGEGSDELYADPDEPTQVLANQHLWVTAVQEPRTGSEEVAKAKEAIDDFVLNYLGGGKDSDDKYHMNVFMCRGWYENNLAQWTMRMCDFLVDRMGWSFIMCSLCNMGEYGQFRKQQLIFRYEGDKRDMPVSAVNMQELDPSCWDETAFPDYWQIPAVVNHEIIHDVVSCTAEEIEALQQMSDATFKRVLTRDRAPDDDAPEDEEMPYRLEVVHAFRNEHAWLHHRFQERMQVSSVAESFFVQTSEPETILTSRLQPGCSYLFHGTNPSSAMSILKTGFVLRHAGSATGTMYGQGVYMAERASKSDEYGRDDGGNTYPGLLALLVCRCFVGMPHLTHEPGDYVSAAKTGGLDCVCGDRESTVGTYREFVFFDEAQVYPEFTVIYKRVWQREKVPEEMRTETSGTTGRFWQYRGDIFGFRGWKNVPTEVNKALIDSARREIVPVQLNLHDRDLMWDVVAKNVTDETGKSSPLRPPMQR
mmetsp:Transcript_108924/g.232755  ORF Transcript_108924/g.232755 Transcript_108924/m.232755 type:complete len:911 (-) Transcript_108924:23-2755(-)